MSWKRVCSLDDLEEGKKLAVEVDGEPVAIVCSEDSVFAILDEQSSRAQRQIPFAVQVFGTLAPIILAAIGKQRRGSELGAAVHDVGRADGTKRHRAHTRRLVPSGRRDLIVIDQGAWGICSHTDLRNAVLRSLSIIS